VLNSISARVALAAGLVIATLAGCGGDSPTDTPRPQTLVASGGDGQTGVVGRPVVQPLQVTVRDSRSRPVAGAWVRWRVSAGAGTLSADSSQTSAAGHATVQLTLGSQPGPYAVTASMGTLSAQLTGTAQSFCQAGLVSEVRKHAGDAQTAFAHDTLPAPLQVRVLCDPATPIANATVQWQVTSGDGWLLSATSQTDASGVASTRLAFGPAVGPIAVRANVAGAEPAVFALTSVDTCTPLPVLAPGQTVEGRLRPVDCARDPFAFLDSRYDAYTIRLEQEGMVRLVMENVWEITRPYMTLLTAGEAREVGRTSLDVFNRFRYTLYAWLPAGTYVVRVAAGTHNDFHTPYRLTWTQDATDACATVQHHPIWVIPGVTVRGTLSPTDCAAGTVSYLDSYRMQVRAGDPIHATARSTAFDARLQVGSTENGLPMIRADDDGAGGTDARVTFTAPEDGTYGFIVSVAKAPTGTGAYTLEIR
jgi:hypothetical protein